MIDRLTGREKKVLDVIVGHMSRHRQAPTYGEVASVLGRHKATVHEQVQGLRLKGWLEPVPDGGGYKSRSFVLTADARAHVQFDNIVERLMGECIMLAKLAAPTPQFDNPLHVYDAEKVRDKWLRVAAAGKELPA